MLIPTMLFMYHTIEVFQILAYNISMRNQLLCRCRMHCHLSVCCFFVRSISCVAHKMYSMVDMLFALQDPNEGPVTKHIHLTSALIIRNLARYSSVGRRCVVSLLTWMLFWYRWNGVIARSWRLCRHGFILIDWLIIIIIIITNKKIKVMLSRKRCRGTLQDYNKG